MKTKRTSCFDRVASLFVILIIPLLNCCRGPESEVEKPDSLFAEMLIGSWKHSDDNGYVGLTLNGDNSIVIVEQRNGSRDEKRGTYSFSVDNMMLSTSISGWFSCKLTSITATTLLLDGNTYYKVDASEIENEATDKRGPVATRFNGSGTKSDPYLINDASELRKLSDDVEAGNSYSGKYFKMTTDITINRNVLTADGELNGDGSNFEQWKPIGLNSDFGVLSHNICPFKGTFDGNGHTIWGIYIDISKKETLVEAALFGEAEDATIQNLTLKDSYIRSDKNGVDSYLASILGFGAGNTIVNNCHNYATIIGNSPCGIACSFSPIPTDWQKLKYIHISNCTNHGKLIGEFPVGIGAMYGSINKCANYGTLIGTNGAYATTPRASMNCCNLGRIKAPHIVFTCPWKCTYNIFNGGALEGEIIEFFTNSEINSSVYNAVIYGSVNSANEVYALSKRISGGAFFSNIYALNTITTTLYEKIDQSLSRDGNIDNCLFMKSAEMKSQSFLDELNANAEALEKETGIEMSRWKFGKNGYPVLDWIEE